MSTPRDANNRKRLLTYCSECGCAILIQHPAVWQRGAAIGLVHAECATDPDAQPFDLGSVSPQRLNDSY